MAFCCFVSSVFIMYWMQFKSKRIYEFICICKQSSEKETNKFLQYIQNQQKFVTLNFSSYFLFQSFIHVILYLFAFCLLSFTIYTRVHTVNRLIYYIFFRFYFVWSFLTSKIFWFRFRVSLFLLFKSNIII